MNNVQVDTSEVEELLRRLSHRNLTKAYKKALRRASSVIAKETKRNLRTRLGRGASHNGRYGRMTKGIKVKVARSSMSSKIHIMGDFRLKFFEKGTNLRQTDNHKNRGRINALNFFSNARDSKEQEAKDVMINSLRESIQNAMQ